MPDISEPYKKISLIYDEIRPSYPEQLIRDIVGRASLQPGDVLLEIGAGTGIATTEFARRGFTIHAVELGEDMAAVFREKCISYPEVSLDVASFEQWDSPAGQIYDMIYCAQAFHWLDSDLKYTKCNRLLKDGGVLVLFWYQATDNSTETAEINRRADEIVRKYAADNAPGQVASARPSHLGASEDEAIRAEIAASGCFELMERISYTREIRNDAWGYLQARKSVPAFAEILDGLDQEAIAGVDQEIEELIQNYGGYVSTVLEFSLYILKKSDSND